MATARAERRAKRMPQKKRAMRGRWHFSHYRLPIASGRRSVPTVRLPFGIDAQSQRLAHDIWSLKDMRFGFAQPNPRKRKARAW